MRAKTVMSGVATGIRRNAAMTIALILSTAIALGFVGAALLARVEIGKFKTQYEDKINVSIYLCATQYQAPCTHKTSEAETQALRTKLSNDPLVRSYSYISEQRAYDLGRAQQPSVAKLLQPGVLPASFTVKLKNVQKDYDRFKTAYSTQPGVGQVQNQIATINTLLDIINSVQWFSIIIAIIVLAAAILLMANTIQVAAAQRKNETSIMRLVGASRWMTELPFVLEAVIATVIGGLLSMIGLWFGERFILGSVFQGPTKNGVIPRLESNDVILAGGTGLIAGIVLAALTAFITLRLYVRL